MLWIPFLLRLRNASGLHLPWLLTVPVALLLVYFMGYFFTAIVARTPVAKAVAGRSRQSWRSLVPARRETDALPEYGKGAGPMDLTPD
jgi:hypothetical protein